MSYKKGSKILFVKHRLHVCCQVHIRQGITLSLEHETSENVITFHNERCHFCWVEVTSYRDNHAAGKLDPSVTFYSWPEFVSVLARYNVRGLRQQLLVLNLGF